MKKLFSLLLPLLSSAGFAQGIPVIDVAHIAMTVANGTVLNDQLNKLGEQVGVSLLIEQQVSKVYNLQQEYREFLRQAETVQDLQWADLATSQEAASAIATSLDAYVTGFDNIEALREAYHHESPAGATALYHLLDGFGAETMLPADLTAFEHRLEGLSINRAALDEMASRKKLQVALSYNALSKDLLEKARELSQALLINQRFSMTEGERLSSIRQAHDMILKSMDLKLEADELVQQVIREAEKDKAGPVRLYEQQLEREVLSATPLFAY